MNVDGEVHDQPADLARLTGLQARYGAVHAYPLVEPETGRSIGSACWGNAILSRSPLGEGFTTGLPRAADDDLLEPADADHPLAGVRYADAEPGHREARCAVGGRFRIDDGTEIGVVTTHLTYIGRGQRASQAAAVAALAATLGGPVIVGGDFNAPIGAAELAPLAGPFEDAFATIGVAPDDPRRQTCGSAAIDHVLTRGVVTRTCRVVEEAGDASDHRPVAVDLAILPA